MPERDTITRIREVLERARASAPDGPGVLDKTHPTPKPAAPPPRPWCDTDQDEEIP